MKIYVGSLQYSPIYKSHCCALGKQCEKYGYSVRYLFSQEYEWMLSEEVKEKTIFIGESTGIISALKDGLNFKHIQKLSKILLEDRPDYIYMYNYHSFLNYYIARLSKKCGSTFIQHVQEPYVENKEVYKGIKQYWLYVFEYFQEKLLKKTDIAVISSNRALYLFEKRCQNFFGRKIMIPLMYEDMGNITSNIEDRIYITFIGPPVAAKGPETFLKIVEYSEIHNLGFNFLMISRSKVKDPRYYNKNNLKVFHKNKISDVEMAEFIRHSLMTITPYKVATQSSVVLTSYMYGTPVISTDVGGLCEVVHHLRTGYLLKENSNVEEWINGIDFIKDNLLEMSENCRNYFVAEFSEINWPKYFKEMFGDES
ncbi:MAG: Glycosyl transferases group 1 [Candidatus Argoarchaeum ethanivorans]|uniref:Glycosyl transferases group 1 n=1 Tax=Candidatus Argoarchaeum ethanivorans TaxID=2608793 RepID=A0A811T4J3_9EURY|nr:MAG: Glycosyl transferases group 1 [Candidatus Argoarchaeum ethanivorans]